MTTPRSLLDSFRVDIAWRNTSLPEIAAKTKEKPEKKEHKEKLEKKEHKKEEPTKIEDPERENNNKKLERIMQLEETLTQVFVYPFEIEEHISEAGKKTLAKTNEYIRNVLNNIKALFHYIEIGGDPSQFSHIKKQFEKNIFYYNLLQRIKIIKARAKEPQFTIKRETPKSEFDTALLATEIAPRKPSISLQTKQSPWESVKSFFQMPTPSSEEKQHNKLFRLYEALEALKPDFLVPSLEANSTSDFCPAAQILLDNINNHLDICLNPACPEKEFETYLKLLKEKINQFNSFFQADLPVYLPKFNFKLPEYPTTYGPSELINILRDLRTKATHLMLKLHENKAHEKQNKHFPALRATHEELIKLFQNQSDLLKNQKANKEIRLMVPTFVLQDKVPLSIEYCYVLLKDLFDWARGPGNPINSLKQVIDDEEILTPSQIEQKDTPKESDSESEYEDEDEDEDEEEEEEIIEDSSMARTVMSVPVGTISTPRIQYLTPNSGNPLQEEEKPHAQHFKTEQQPEAQTPQSASDKMKTGDKSALASAKADLTASHPLEEEEEEEEEEEDEEENDTASDTSSLKCGSDLENDDDDDLSEVASSTSSNPQEISIAPQKISIAPQEASISSESSLRTFVSKLWQSFITSLKKLCCCFRCFQSSSEEDSDARQEQAKARSLSCPTLPSSRTTSSNRGPLASLGGFCSHERQEESKRQKPAERFLENPVLVRRDQEETPRNAPSRSF